MTLLSGVARGDGALPDSMVILAPPDRPHELILTTNFGLIVSEDDGTTWRWVCEQAIGTLVNLYQMGPAPTHTVYAVSPSSGLTLSGNFCDWTAATDEVTGPKILDVFADPSDASHVLALVTTPLDGGVDRSALIESHDGGRTFSAPLYVAPPGGLLTGVEIARSSPATFYLAGFTNDSSPLSTRAFLVRSNNAGASFETLDESAATMTRTLRIAAVDPADAQKLYLRVVDPAGADRLAISTDGGASLRIALTLQNPMSSFLRRANGTILVGTRAADLFVSSDGGSSFQSIPSAPHLRGLGERGSTLYASACSLLDGYAFAVSDDGGASWRPSLRFPQIEGPMSCANIASLCASPWQMLQAMWNPSSPPPDAGTSQPHGGCGCRVAQQAPGGYLAAIFLVLGVGVWRRLRAATGRRR
jgi:hypothetical protein